MRSFFPLLLLILVAGFAISTIPGILATDELTASDAIGHFEGWRDWRANRVVGNGIHTYSWTWGAGATLMKFYPPLAPFLVEVVEFVTGSSEQISFRILVVTAYLLPGFMIFLVARRAIELEGVEDACAYWYAVIPALAWFVFPRHFFWNGMGLNSIVGGMVYGSLGLSLFLFTTFSLLTFTLIKRAIWLYIAALGFGITPLVHIVAAVAQMIFLLLLMIRWPKDLLRLEVIASFLFGGLLSAVWAYPFLLDRWLVALGPSWPVGDMLIMILPLRMDLLLNGEWGGNLLGTAIGLLALVGVGTSFRKHPKSVGLISLSLLFVICGTDLSRLFGEDLFHFYRLFPHLFSFFICYSAYGAWRLQLLGGPLRSLLVALLLIVGLYDGYRSQRWEVTEDYPTVPRPFRTGAFNGSVSAWGDQELAYKLYGALKAVGYEMPQRIAIETEHNVTIDGISSSHGLRFALTRLGVQTLGGLFVEGSPTWRVGGSAFCAVSYTNCWGPHFFKFYPGWFKGSPPAAWKTLEEYGVSYVLARSPKFKENLRTHEYAKSLHTVPFGGARWELWQLPMPRPLVFPPSFLPALYVDHGNGRGFARLSEQHFLHDFAREVPVLFNAEISAEAARDLACRVPQQLSAIIVRDRAPAEQLMDSNETCGVPVILAPALRPEERAPLVDVAHRPDDTYGEAFVALDRSKIATSERRKLSLLNYDNLSLEFDSDDRSPVIINGGYDTDWTHHGGVVYASSPYLRMAVFADSGPNSLSYRPDQKGGAWVSLFALACLLILALTHLIREAQQGAA